MATNFPASLDALTNPTAGDALNSPSHASQHANSNDAIEALQAKVGVDGSAVATSIDYKLNNTVATLTGTQTLTNKTLMSPVIEEAQVVNLLEKFTRVTTAAPTQIDVDMVTGNNLIIYTTNASADFQARLLYNGSTSPYLSFPANTSFTFALAVKQGATAYKHLSTISIDGANKTVAWQGGTAPSAGNANSYDLYVFTVLYFGSAIYQIFGSQTKFA